MKLKILLVLSLLLISGCSNKTDQDPARVEEAKLPQEETLDRTEASAGEEDLNKTEDLAEDELVSQDTEDEINPSQEEVLDDLIEKSDYISKVRMTQTGPSGKEINIVEDYKGSLKSIIIKDLDNVEANKEYLVFLMDSPSGDIIATENSRPYEIQGPKDERLLYVIKLTQEDKE